MNLHYIAHGYGTPIILLHGFPLDLQAWNLVTPYFTDGSRIIVPDLRGFGGSRAENNQSSMTDMARDVVQLMDFLEVEQSIVAGHSMGGYVALEMLKQVPERILGIALVASHIYADSDEKKNQRKEIIEELERETPEKVFAKMPIKLSLDRDVQKFCKQVIELSDKVGLQAALLAMANRESSEFVWENSKVPKLIIAGGKDSFIPKCLSEKCAASGKNVIYTMFERAGHMLLREQPAKTAKAILKFKETIRRY